MKRNWYAVTAMGLSAAMLSGCGQKPAESAPAATTAATEAAATAAQTEAPSGTVVTGEAEGYGGPVKAEVTVDGDKIVGLTLTGDKETPEIGGKALEALQEAILKSQGLEGVDAIAGATWTSEGVFQAVRTAMGEETAGEQAGEVAEVEATGLSHGLGFSFNGRLGPGKDDKDTGVYSFNEVAAYVLFDDGGRILDLEVDQVEVATPNYDGEHMPHLTGFPGQSYNADENHDEQVDTVLEQTEETFLKEVEAWQTKRERGSTYKLNSGTWEDEMDIFEEFFRGMTVEEVEAWFASYCSELNGRPLHGTSDKDEDKARYEAFTEDEKKALDAISGATMSLNDAHGNIIEAIRRAYDSRRPVETEKVARIGLGLTSTGRLGPGKDDQETGVYSFNTQAVGGCFDEDGTIIALYTDVLEVATPNYDGEHMPHLTGFPGQSYNGDENHDEQVDTVLEQTEETFLKEIEAWQTKRERGSTYKLNSGTWAQEMDIFEKNFAGMTAGQVEEWFDRYCSDLNGRPLSAASDKDEDKAKYDKLTDEEKSSLDGVSGATMSLRDAHGDILGAVIKAWELAKETSITVSK